MTAAARQAAVAAEKVPVNVDAVNRSYVTLGSFSWDQDNDKIKVGPSFLFQFSKLDLYFFLFGLFLPSSHILIWFNFAITDHTDNLISVLRVLSCT